jgi:single-stranded DNA-binding protein
MPVDKTSWFRISAFNPPDYVQERVKKGTLVLVEGDVAIDHRRNEETGKNFNLFRITQSPFTFGPILEWC